MDTQSRKIGYARVSTKDQSTDAQIRALKQTGCCLIFTDDGISGNVSDREGLAGALSALQAGDTLVVWRLDRLARSLGYLCSLLDQFATRGIGFISLNDGIDTTTHSGKMLCQILGAIAEFERNIIIERTMLGMEHARKAGKHLGRPPKLSQCRLRCAHRLIHVKGWHINEVASLCRVSPVTLRRGFKGLGAWQNSG